MHDSETTPLVVIVDEELAARSFPNRSLHEVVGKRLRFGGDNDGWREIVGIVRHVKQNGLDEDGRAQIYRPWTQITPKWRANLLRATDNREDVSRPHSRRSRKRFTRLIKVSP